MSDPAARMPKPLTMDETAEVKDRVLCDHPGSAAIVVIKTPNAIRAPEDTMVMSAQAATMIQP